MFGALHDGVAAFGYADGAYARVEANARAFADYLDANVTVPLEAAAMIADACTTAHPELRHPLSAQADVDSAHLLTDAEYLRMCAYDDIPTIVGQHGPALAPWLLG
jgi:hypothetical protein